MIDRRQLLRNALMAGLGAGFAGEALAAGLGSAFDHPDWALALGDLPGDVSLQSLRRLHGKAPAGLAGTLYRNGPALFRRGDTAVGHWFDGDGLVRAFRVGNGGATVAARFVDTAKRRTEASVGRIVQPGFNTPTRDGAVLSGADDANPANTHVIAAGDRLLALWEAGSAMALDPATLATQGPVVFRNDLKGMPFLAHPRIEPNGRIWNLGMGGRQAFVWRVSPQGMFEAGQMIDLPCPSYAHDFTATARHIIIVLQPWLHEADTMPYASGMRWRPEQGTRVLVLDKGDLSKRRLYQLPAFFFFHLGDAWEDADGTIRFDACLHKTPVFVETGSELVQGRYDHHERPMLTMLSLHPDGRTAMTATGLTAEFPRSAPDRAGLPRPRTFHVGGYQPSRPFAQSIASWDWAHGKADTHVFGPRQIVEEFVPAGRWLIGTTINLDARATELHVLDSRRLADGPVVSWRADVALPHSFHGSWVAA